MPKRTNKFQKLIAALQIHLDPKSLVEESAMMTDLTTGTEREVDVCVRGSVGGQPIVVSIECRDHRRPADVRWVQEQQAKHQHLETNTLVLVSHSGFSKEAHRKAVIYNIRLLSLKDINDSSPERLFPGVESLWAKAWKLGIEKVTIVVDQAGDIPRHKVRAFPDNEICLDDGSTLGSAKELADALIRSEPVNKKLASEGRNEHTFASLGWPRPMIQGRKLCLKRLEPETLLPILEVLITAKCTVAIDEFPLRHGKYGDVRVAWGAGVVYGNEALLLATSDPAGKLSFSLRTTAERLSQKPG